MTAGAGTRQVGPAAVLTDDLHPRSVDSAGRPGTGADRTPVGVVVHEGVALRPDREVLPGSGRWVG